MLAAQFPAWSAPQVRGLAQWSVGLGLSRSCALTAVSLFWATALAQQEHTVRQRLREWG